MTAGLATHMTVSIVEFAGPRPIAELATSSPTAAHLFSADGVNDLMAGVGAATDFERAARVSLHSDLDSAIQAMREQWGPAGWECGTRWAAVLEPFRHVGEVDWLRPECPGPIFSVAEAADPSERLAVLTTAGWDMAAEMNWARPIEFSERVTDVLDQLAGTPGLQYGASFAFRLPTHGITFTIWESVKAMQTFAYRPGVHKPHMDYHLKTTPLLDYTSFTRFRIVTEVGGL